jgi:hypothetical protein
MARQYVDVKTFEPSFNYIDEKNNLRNNFKNTAIESIHTTTKLNFAFFSPQNIKIIQNALRYEVWRRTSSKHLIGEQSETELGIIMRAIYLQYGKNLPTNVAEQVQELNNIVIETLVPKIIIQIEQYMDYLRDISTPYRIMDNPQSTNVVGRKTFNLARFI